MAKNHANAGIYCLEQILKFKEMFAASSGLISSAGWGEPQYSKQVTDFIHAMYDSGFIITYNWMDWSEWAQVYLYNRELYNNATLLDIRKILTGAVRSERFGPGIIAQLIKENHLSVIIKRIEEIYQTLKQGKTFWGPISCGPLPGEQTTYTGNEWSYWADPCKVMAGAYPGDLRIDNAEQKLEYLVSSGIRQVISLIEPGEKGKNQHDFVPYLDPLKEIAERQKAMTKVDNFPVMDMNIPSKETMIAILNQIDIAISQEQPVYIHCHGGHGRTGTVVGCYLVRHNLAKGKKALEQVSRLHRNLQESRGYPSPQTDKQREMIINWKPGQ